MDLSNQKSKSNESLQSPEIINDINVKTDIIFYQNCGRALTPAHSKFQEAITEVVDPIPTVYPRFTRSKIDCHIKTIREKLSTKMNDGERPRFFVKDKNDYLIEIKNDAAINDKIYERMKKRKNYMITKEKKDTDKAREMEIEMEIAMRMMAEKDPNFLKKYATKLNVKFNPVPSKKTTKSKKKKKKIPTPKKASIQKNKKTSSSHSQFKKWITAKHKSPRAHLELFDPSLPLQPPLLPPSQPPSQPPLQPPPQPLSKSPSMSSMSSSSSSSSSHSPPPTPTTKVDDLQELIDTPESSKKGTEKSQQTLVIELPIGDDLPQLINRFQFDSTPEGNCGYTSIMHLLNIENYPDHKLNMNSSGNVSRFRRWCSYKMMQALLDPSIKYFSEGEECKLFMLGSMAKGDLCISIYNKEFSKNYMPRRQEAQIPVEYWLDISAFGPLMSFILKKSLLVHVYNHFESEAKKDKDDNVVKDENGQPVREKKNKPNIIWFFKYDSSQPKHIPTTTIIGQESKLKKLQINKNECFFLHHDFSKHFDPLVDEKDRETHNKVVDFYKEQKKKQTDGNKYNVTTEEYDKKRLEFDEFCENKLP